ncbi:hypothetical protein [Bradyrhizobium sp. AUGA SZCCT0222]|uniref:hypothetical protein n=1 Tax=Bradyrhizobium sp. AUGA SZCCT0222 TaxID=2807668 RepID=UPI0020139BBD|nr:hypothetical protein [Bradyrhizobium sp. AUGA SZCCT0222]
MAVSRRRSLGNGYRARAGIAYVPQGREIIPDFSIRETILMGSFARADGIREIPPLVAELFPYRMSSTAMAACSPAVHRAAHRFAMMEGGRGGGGRDRRTQRRVGSPPHGGV